MKKLLFLAILLLILSCGGRKSTVDISKEKKTESSSGSIVENSVINSNLSKNTTTENATGSTITEEKKETAKQEEVKESTSQKSAAETSGKSLKRKTYFENGNLKSETDYTENFSKIESENETLKSKITTQKATISDLKSANISLQRISDNQKITIGEERNLKAKYQSENSELKKFINKKTEREGSSFWMYLAIILFVYGVVVTAILKFK